MALLTGITPSESSELNSSYNVALAFNGITDAAWAYQGWTSADVGMPQWIQAQVSTGFVAVSYVLSASNGASVAQTPNTWTFLGSNDGTTWTTLDTQTGQANVPGGHKFYSFANTTAYTYYRINVTATNGATSCAISELAIYDAAPLTYTGEVNKDYPWGFWNLTEVSGTTLANVSTNTEGGTLRDMTISGSAHTLNQSGPGASLASIGWGNTAGYAGTTDTVNTSDVTLEGWVYLPANPLGNTAITGHGVGFGTGTHDKTLYVDTSGRVCLNFYPGVTVVITASASLSLNTWHHVVGSIGAAGAKIRVDKITVGTDAATTSYNGQSQNVFMRGGGGAYNGYGAMRTAAIARYLYQLSDARTDAHYDAVMASGVSTVSGAAALSATSSLTVAGTSIHPLAFASVTASDWYGSEPPANAVDGNPATNWTTAGGALPAWWKGLLATDRVATAYAITRRDDIPTRNIKDFLFQGCIRRVVPTTAITTASSQLNTSTYAAINATDGSFETRWAAAGPSQWLRMQLPSAAVISVYSLGGFPSELSGAPGTWAFQGSNDASTWTTLDSRSGVVWSPRVMQAFTFANSTAYLYYQLNITAISGVDDYTRVARFELSDATETWDTLDTRAGVTWPTPGQTQTFSFVNTNAYAQYRVYITANSSDQYTSLAEITVSGSIASPSGSVAITAAGSLTVAGTVTSPRPDNLGGPASEVLSTQAQSVTGGETADGAADGNPGTSWTSQSNNMPTWWSVHLRAAKVVTTYRISGRGDILGRNVKDFTFQGSNDGVTWTVLDTRAGITWPTTTTQVFTFTNSTAYSWYMVNITANNGDSYTSIAEITFDGVTFVGTALSEWYKADAIGIADGAALTSWADSSGSSHTLDAVNGTAPIYRSTGGPLGGPCVDHTVAAGGLHTSLAYGNTPKSAFSFFAVVRHNGGGAQGLLGANENNGGAYVLLSNSHIELQSNYIISIVTSAAAVPANVWSILYVDYDAVAHTSHFNINGVDYDGGYVSTQFINPAYVNYGNNRSTDTGQGFAGKMAEIGRYSNSLNASEKANLLAYLNNKYVTPNVAAAFTAVSSLTAVGVDVVQSSAALAATSTLTGVADSSSEAALAAASTLTAAAIVTPADSTNLTAASTLNTAATLTIGGAADLAANGTLTAASPLTLDGAASLTAGSSLTTSAAVSRVSAKVVNWDISQPTVFGSGIVLPAGGMLIDPDAPSGVGALGSIRFPKAIDNNWNVFFTLTLQLDAVGTISFYQRREAENGYDGLRFYIDGIQVFQNLSTTTWALSSFATTVGTHTFKWAMTTDSSVIVGLSTAWVSLLRVTGVFDPNSAVSLVAESLLFDGLPGFSALVADSLMTVDALIGADAHLVSTSSLSGNAATVITADVALVASTSLVAPALVVPRVPAPLGAVALAVGPRVTVASLPQSGTLASPFPAADTDARVLDFATALYVATDPVPVAAPPLSPSIWYVFTESQIADLTVSSGVMGGAVVEVYSGPPGAKAGDLTFIATDGVAPITLGAVTLAVGPAIAAGNIMIIDLGVVTVTAAPVLAGALT